MNLQREVYEILFSKNFARSGHDFGFHLITVEIVQDADFRSV